MGVVGCVGREGCVAVPSNVEPPNRGWAGARWALLLAGLWLAGGCQVQAVSTVQLRHHQQIVDLDGLKPIQSVPGVHATCAPPRGWRRLEADETFLYTHQQWRSPARNAGMGVAYIHTPIPLSGKMLVWFAKAEYLKHNNGGASEGRLINEWTDPLGRSWFEAENARYHVKGFAMTRGTDAWIVYSGWRVRDKPSDADIELGARAADSVVPLMALPTAPAATTRPANP